MKIEKIKYPDGSFYTKVELVKDQTEYNLTFRINSYEDLWQLRQIKDVCDHNKVKVNLTIPNLFDAQADRRFNEDEPANLKLVCKFINEMKFNSVTVFHPHNQEATEALIDDVKIIDNSNFIYQCLKWIQLNKYKGLGAECNLSQLILMSTDAGGFKPLMKLCDKLNWSGETASASKSREYIDGKSKLTQLIAQSDFRGKDILIIDDISVYGGTFKGLAKMLKERNCGKLYLAVSHITMQNLGEDPVTDYFDKVFTTNSKYNEYWCWTKGGSEINPPNLEIIKLF